MAAFEMTEPKLICPTSGPFLRAVIHAFQLAQDGTDSPETLVGSAPAQRSERRYLEGEDPSSDDVRNRAAAQIASALIDMGLVADASLPRESGHSSIRGALIAAVTNWARTWDEVYRQCSVGWPFVPRSLGGFVLGREVVMDLVLRVAAVIHLTSPDLVLPALHSAHDHAGRKILEEVMKRQGRPCDFKEVANAGAVETRTAQRWLNESSAPEDFNTRHLAHSLAGKDAQSEAALLTYLRLQYGLLRLAQHLESVIGHRWTRDLFQAFERLLKCAVRANGEIRQIPGSSIRVRRA